MAPRTNQGPAYLDAHHQRISEFAAEYLDDDEERDTFVTEFMTRRGYKPQTRTEWSPPEPEGDGGGSGGGGGTKARPAYFKSQQAR